MLENKMFDETIAKTMIIAHEAQFGRKPEQLIFPLPDTVEFQGIKVVFHPQSLFCSVDKSNCLHHHFSPEKQKKIEDPFGR